MNERKKLLRTTSQHLESIIPHLDDTYKSILVLVVEQPSKKFTIYFVREKTYYATLPYSKKILHSSCFIALENVVDYKYDESCQILLVNVETSDKTGYWTGFPVYKMIYSYVRNGFSFDNCLKVSYSHGVPEAFFRKDFFYLPTARIVNIAGKNYIIGYSFWSKLNEIKPLYYDRFLEIGPSGAIIYSCYSKFETLFGPFPSIVPFENGEYPYFQNEPSHGYLGKDENNNIISMLITRDKVAFDSYFYSNLDYLKTFHRPLQSLKFLKRDLEKKKKNHHENTCCARDICN